MSAREELLAEYGRATEAPLGTLRELRQRLDTYRAEILREAAVICRAQAPKDLGNEVDMAIFWALDSAAAVINSS